MESGADVLGKQFVESADAIVINADDLPVKYCALNI